MSKRSFNYQVKEIRENVKRLKEFGKFDFSKKIDFLMFLGLHLLLISANANRLFQNIESGIVSSFLKEVLLGKKIIDLDPKIEIFIALFGILLSIILTYQNQKDDTENLEMYERQIETALKMLKTELQPDEEVS
ncbi:MAG: hypothetical protein Fur0024_3810 [Patescibacteria group bacterium]